MTIIQKINISYHSTFKMQPFIKAMNVIVFVLNLKKIIQNYLINSVNPKYFKKSNPGLLEQAPGLNQGLIVLFYEHFYDT